MMASFFIRKMKHGNLKSKKKANIESFSTFDVGFFGDSQYEGRMLRI